MPYITSRYLISHSIILYHITLPYITLLYFTLHSLLYSDQLNRTFAAEAIGEELWNDPTKQQRIVEIGELVRERERESERETSIPLPLPVSLHYELFALNLISVNFISFNIIFCF